MNKYKLTVVFISKDDVHSTYPYNRQFHYEYYKTLKEAKARFESFKSCKDTMLFINRESDGKCLKYGTSDNILTNGKFSFE
jgi:hypothetical protein